MALFFIRTRSQVFYSQADCCDKKVLLRWRALKLTDATKKGAPSSIEKVSAGPKAEIITPY